MLVLSRRRDEKILIRVPAGVSRDVWLTVVELRGDKVRLGLDAPIDVEINREEVVERMNAAVPNPPKGADEKCPDVC